MRLLIGTTIQQDASCQGSLPPADGKTFEAVAKIAAAGHSNQQIHYEWLGDSPLKNSYYRIRTIDFDGLETLSEVIYLQRVGEEQSFVFTNLYPVSAKDEVWLEFTVPQEEQVQTLVIDVMGRVIQHEQFRALNGRNTFALSTYQLASGVYFVKLTRSNGQVVTKRLLIQHN